MDARVSLLDSVLRRSPAAAVEHHDPVCGVAVSESSVHHSEWDGLTYWFCSAGCRSRFLGNPRHYLAIGAPQDTVPDLSPELAAAAPADGRNRAWILGLVVALMGVTLALSLWPWPFA